MCELRQWLVALAGLGPKKSPLIRPTLTGWRRLYLFLTLYFFFIVKCLSISAAMRCIIRKAQSVRWEELPVKASEELPLPIGLSQPTTKLASLSHPPIAALFAAAVGTPSNPNTPVFHGTSPSFTAFKLETPSPTFSAFPFSSISPKFSFPTPEVSAATPQSIATVNKQEKKPETPKQSTNLKITLTRKRDDEYVIEKFHLHEEMPKNDGNVGVVQGAGTVPKSSVTVTSDTSTMEGEHFSFDLAAMSRANFSMGSSFQDVTAGLDGSAVVSTGGPAAVPTSDSIAAVSALGIGPSGIEGLPSTADLFDIGAAGAEGTELEGILQNLSGVLHLSTDIVPGGSALDFDAGLGM